MFSSMQTVSNFVCLVGWRWLSNLLKLLCSIHHHLLHRIQHFLLHHLRRRRRPQASSTTDVTLPPPMSTTQKRCLYEVLGLPQSCTQDEIRTAYKKLALQRHPDKLVQSGISAAEATASFQELVHAYEVLSDPKERQWYDSHRSQILFSDPNASDSRSPIPDLFSFFSVSCYTDYTNSKTGFYRVYGDVFNRIYANEVNYVRKLGLDLGLVKEAPLMGDLNSAFDQANAFYGYWLAFSTVMDFAWVDQFDAAAGVNRKSRRLMEEENKKLRRKAKREYNETVRGLAEFVKKRDKRVIDMLVRKEKEREKKLEEERERKRAMERDKLERARLYEEPEWARLKEEELQGGFEDNAEEGEEKGRGSGVDELYCVACGKKFKSDKQWKNHEQSKKHKDRIAELKESFVDEDDVEEVEEEEEDQGLVEHEKEERSDDHGTGFASVEDCVDELDKKFGDGFVLEEEEEEQDNEEYEIGGMEETIGLHDETSVLEAMLSGRKNRRHLPSRHPPEVSSVNNDIDNVESNSQEAEFMEYNNCKSSRKSRRAKKEKGKSFYGEELAKTKRASSSDTEGNAANQERDDGLDGSNASTRGGVNDEVVELDTQRTKKAGKRTVERKGDVDLKPKNSSKGKKTKAKQKNADPICEKCGEEFESRNRLHKHLTETGHGTLKSR
ncbi:hypothetical protein Dimus_005016 [Dionaea muscipula]